MRYLSICIVLRYNTSVENIPIQKSEYEALADFRYALRQFMHFSEEAAEKTGLTPQQHQALLAVMGFPGREQVTIGELAERLQIHHHSAVGLVDRLAAQGLVVRHHDTADRRHVYISLKERGLAVLEGLSTAHRDELHQLGAQLHRLLERIDSFSDEN
jgi:DNA-binding MarR family transcriptional regulator